jgi:hypothetical protein
VRATKTSRVVVESVTPRIDSERRCRCGATVVWDEVYGWLHTARPPGPCSGPGPGPARRRSNEISGFD